MTNFIVSTKNIVAKMIACKALKKMEEDNPEAHALYIKACIPQKAVIVISNQHELWLWYTALQNYKPLNKAELKIHRALMHCAIVGLQKRHVAIYK